MYTHCTGASTIKEKGYAMNIIEKCLKKHKLNINTLSKILGYNQSVMSRVYNDKQDISSYMLMSIYMFEHLNIDVKNKLIKKYK